MTISIADLRKRQSTLSQIETKEAQYQSKPKDKDSRFWSPTFDPKTGGSATIRFLPSADINELPYVEIIKHQFKHNANYYNELSLRTLNQDDPVTQLNGRLWNTGVESDKKQAQNQKQKKRFIANVLVIKDAANPDNVGKVFLYEFGPAIWNKLHAAMFPAVEGESAIDIFDVFEGANFNIKITPQDLNGNTVPNYSNSYVSEETSQIKGDIEEILPQLHSLKEFIDPSLFKTYDQLASRLVEVLGATTGSGIETVVGYADKVPTSSVTKPNAKSKIIDDDDLPFGDVTSSKSNADDEDDDDDHIKKMRAMLANLEDD